MPSGEKVAFGTRIAFLLNGEEKILSLVGDDEADPSRALVSFSAPISRALIGLEVGDFADFAGREDAIEVLRIEMVAQS